MTNKKNKKSKKKNKRIDIKKFKKLPISLSIIGVFLIVLGALFITSKTNIISSAYSKLLEGSRVFTREVPSVEIESNNYNNPGSWHIDKSAKWIKAGKAEIKFDLKTITKEEGTNKHDILLVLDRSGSMSGNKLSKIKEDASALTEAVLLDTNNRMALITFESSSTIDQSWTNDKTTMLNKINAITDYGMTNYNAGYKNAYSLLENYQKENGRDLLMLFLTDGEPNDDTPNQIGTYQMIKDKHPYITINGVQYEMGNQINQSIIEVTDNQWVANMNSLNNVLFEAGINTIPYETFVVEDYIDDEYFYVESQKDIKVSKGTVQIVNENNKQKIIWTLTPGFKTGSGATMTINAKLKDKDFESIKYFPTNEKEIITSKIEGETQTKETFEDTPVLYAGSYNVIYDNNEPTGCTTQSIPTEKRTAYANVTKNNTALTCTGYNFKGWEIITPNVKKLNDDVFVMPEKDVTLRALWTSQDITKSMDGIIKGDNSLVSVVQRLCKEETYTQGNGDGVYATNSYTEGSETKYHECRYVGANPNNYVKFNDDMYQIIGVFDDYSHGVTGEDLVKIISADLMTASSYGVYNTDNTSETYSGYSNNWTGTGQTSPSNSYLLLNEYFLNKTKTSSMYGDCSNWTYYMEGNTFKTKDCNTLIGYGIKDSYRGYIEDATWYLYGYVTNYLSKQDMYNCERGRYSGCISGNSGANDTEKQAKIGLMYPSDYLYASGYIASNATMPQSLSERFGVSNWLYKGREWTITPLIDSSSSQYVYSFAVHNYVFAYDRVQYGGGIRPVLYLKSSVCVTGGTGTFDDPYLIEN